MVQTFDITHESVDIQLIPKEVFGTWPRDEIRLVFGNHLPICIMVSAFVIYWFLLVPFVFPATRPKSERAIARAKVWKDWHNITMTLYSGICCFGTLYYLYSTGELFSWHAILCNPVEGTWLRVLSATFTISKIWEWFDTMFIVWLGKHPPQFLHKYHHATTFWLFCYVMNQPGAEKLGMLLNGFVHFLMYSHYYRKWPKAYVPIITILQIMQLTTVIYTWHAGPGECPRFANVKKEFPLQYNIPYTMVPVFLLLFVKFFVNRFLFKKPKKGKEEAKKD